MPPIKANLCETENTGDTLTSSGEGASCKLHDQYLQLAMGRAPGHGQSKTEPAPEVGKSTQAPEAPNAKPQAVPGQNVDVPLKVDGQDRSYQIYWPKSHSVTEQLPIVFAADGLSTADSSPAKHMGAQDGLFAQADKDGFAVATLEPKRTAWFGLGLVHMHFWNMENSVLGYDPKQQNDTKYAAAVQGEVSKNFNINPSHDQQFCIGFSNGGQLCRDMDVKAVALDASTKQDDEPQTKPGKSAVIFHGANDEVLPYEGGYYGPWSMAGTNIWWVQKNLDTARFDHSNPSALLPDYVQANNMSKTENKDTPFFRKNAYTSPDGSVRAVEYLIKNPYGGHNYNGGHAKNDSGYLWSANTNVIPRKILDSTHVASCFFGLRKEADCASEGADN